MKKIILVTAIVSASLGLFGSCAKSAVAIATRCDDEVKKVTEAATAYSADPTNKAKCQAYANAIGAFIKACPTFYSAVAKKDLEDFAANSCK